MEWGLAIQEGLDIKIQAILRSSSCDNIPKAVEEVWRTNLALGIWQKLQGKAYPTIVYF